MTVKAAAQGWRANDGARPAPGDRETHSNRRIGQNLGVLLLMATASVVLAPAALAQSAEPTESAPSVEPSAEAPPADDGIVEQGELVVTGSRITSGFQTPTPVTVARAEDLRAAAPSNLADGLIQLPTFSGGTRTTQGGGANVSAGSNGQNLLAMRGLGSSRTLVLLDGHRLVGTNQNGTTDVNILPQNLVSRVDVVTGGASAAYGSDAVAGVVNFVLDTTFEGFKAEAQTGISTYGDSQSYDVSLAYGTSFADERGRAIFSAQYVTQNGIGILDDTHRDWWETSSGQIPNPAGGLPSVIRIDDIRSSVGSYGGLISSGPLRGTQFLPGGAPAPFDYGDVTGASFQSGGDGGNPANGISPDQRRISAFAHAEFDVNDAATLFAEVLYAKSSTTINATITPQVGAGGQFTIFRDNAYLPTATLDAMIAANVQSIPLGRYELEFHPVVIDWETEVTRGAVGVKGAFGAGWTYDASYTYGQSVQIGGQRNLPNLRRLYAAADAVVDTATGDIVCRSTLMGYDPGCVPMNLFGAGSISQEAADYILGDSVKELTLTQQVAMFNVSGDFGDLFQFFGAGPISLAAGLEYRKEDAEQTSDAVSRSVLSFVGVRGAPSSLNNRLGGYQFNNPQPLNGGFHIEEGYAEIGVPLLADLPFAQALDFNAAVRRTNYSQSGGVTTWKYGFSYEVNDDWRLRYTQSEDIRGPSVLELFNAQTQTNQNVLYNGVLTQDTVIQSGNPNLSPEIASTTTYGFVFSPSWLPGFQASVDYYEIAIEDAIGQLGHQTIVDQCAAGNALFCSQITVNSNGTLIVRSQGLNLNQVETSGYDFELQYATELWGGDLNLRFLGNHLSSSSLTAPGSAPLSDLGSPGSWEWRFNLSARYSRDNWSVFLQERYLHDALIDPNKVQGVDLSLNDIEAQWYTDLTLTYDFTSDGDYEAFFSVTNLFNQDPPISGGNPTTYSVPVNFAYDLMGRYFSTGVRLRF